MEIYVSAPLDAGVVRLGEIDSVRDAKKRKCHCGEFKEKEFEVRLDDFWKRRGNGKNLRAFSTLILL